MFLWTKWLHHIYVLSNISENEPTRFPIAHYDTSPDFNGENVKPTNLGRLQRWRFGSERKQLVSRFLLKIPKPEKICRKTLITTDGTSLLGADDKAGVAEIVTAAEYLWRIQILNTEELRSVLHQTKKLEEELTNLM